MAKRLSTWRQIALSAWGPPRDPTAYGALDIDIERALQYLETLRERSGERVTLTHLVGKAIAMGMAEIPEVNAYVSRGTLVSRKTVDIFFQISFFSEEGKEHASADLGGAKIVETNEKSLVDIARELREKAERIRSRSDDATEKNARAIAKIPRSLIGPATRFGAIMSYDWGLNLSRFGIPFDAFGSCMVTSVGAFGLPSATAPLSEMSRVPMVLTIASVREAPCAREGQVVVGKRVNVGVSFDHRVMDGYHAGIIGQRFFKILEDPERELGLPRAL